MKENIDIFAGYLCTSINSAIKLLSFPSSFKSADVTPVHKRGRNDIEENFRPVSILPTLLKMFEKCMFVQMPAFFDNIFSNQQCGFRKRYSTQHCPLVMLETWKRSADKSNIFDILLTDLSKAIMNYLLQN